VPNVDTEPVVGFIDRLDANYVVGWMCDVGQPSRPVSFRLVIDGKYWEPVTADIYRVSSSWQINPGSRGTIAQTPSASIIVHVDSVAEGRVTGWAYDESAIATPAVLHLYVDTQFAMEFCCDANREDVRSSGHPSASVGFSVDIPSAYCDDETHSLEIRSPSGLRVQMADASGVRHPSQDFCFPSIALLGRVDGLHDGAIRGWALQHDRRTDHKKGGLQVLVTLLGQPIGQMVANQFRADVAESLTADQVFTQLWALRAKVKGGRQDSPTPLSGDPRRRGARKQPLPCWAATRIAALSSCRLRKTFPDLDTVKKLRELLGIVCPTYRPRMKDFVAAVESVIAQTYPHCELILVDDASGSPELTACIEAFAKRDRRIRSVFLTKNGGISIATNEALKKAEGHYVAFFDHDDLMVERAMELMVDAALRTGAKMLYCDEDKIDDDGVFSEVNLKPDWNYRLLLAQNYVCHILFVERAHLGKAGPLRKECDGAQDHDLILRLAEITPPEAIHHVPEILYHWRKTPFSTAASGKSKAYAVAAGVRAVADHLGRKGLRGEVDSPLAATFYDIKWTVDNEPKVTIIIPYREHIGMTRECVDAIRGVTDYRNYEIVLVDNWSTSDDALAFAEEMDGQEGMRVIRVPESFNYSRINNLAAAQTEGEFLLFLNNDVFVKQGSWLTQMVGEALADPRVGIVGAKLLYPSGLVQHGGIVLGVGGIADHAHRGLAADDPGYMARAICAQDLSAVTAACMLCRREVFDQVGRFDEVDLRVAFNDVDLCLNVGAAGYRIVWTPGVVAEHRES